MMHGLLVFLGGGVGVVLRAFLILGYYYFKEAILNYVDKTGTTDVIALFIAHNEKFFSALIILTINTFACLLIGASHASLKNESVRQFLMTGVLGGLSTLATIDTYLLWSSTNEIAFAVVNIILTFILGILACHFGVKLGGNDYPSISSEAK